MMEMSIYFPKVGYGYNWSMYGHESIKRHKCKCCVLLETNLTIITDGNHDTQRSVKIPFISYLESPSSQNTS